MALKENEQTKISVNKYEKMQNGEYNQQKRDKTMKRNEQKEREK